MPALPLPSADECFDLLRQLALDVSIQWSSANDRLWRALDSELWDQTGNPCLVLDATSRVEVEQLCGSRSFRAQVQATAQAHRNALAAPAWFATRHGDSALSQVAYFSMEYMLSEALPIYSGGLGNVAGDQLKAASELGVPVTGVGILWQHGYFRQEIDSEGRQQAMYPVNDTRQLPVEPLLDAEGQPVRLAIRLPGVSIWIRGWQARVGRNRLLLLDTNDAANPAPVRLITGQLYGGDNEMRLRQELVLGIGGWRLLKAVGVEPEICHLNDGHAAFAVLERARSHMQAHGVCFAEALAATRPGNLFTTHTPVAAGFDRYDPALLARYLGRYAEQELGIPMSGLLALGRSDPADVAEPLNMAYLAMRCAGAVNGVSRMHGGTSRSIFQGLFPRWPTHEVPIGHVTNGVHTPMWTSAPAQALLAAPPADAAPDAPEPTFAQVVAQASDSQLWELRNSARARLVRFAHAHLARSLAMDGATPEAIEHAGGGLDPHRLTLGFARRFAPYKRPTLLLHDPQRLLRLLTDRQRPMQLLVAGKAHPADVEGQALLRAWHQFIQRPEVQGHVVFLEDYDVRVARALVQGVDVWVNTPRPPWEASGTSGMKVLANGGLNLSQRDGWWAEACEGDVGWSIGDGQLHDASHDAVDAAQLYDLLEHEVAPAFYARNADGVPEGWLRRMRRSMAELVPRFTAARAVREYTETYYLPGARGYRARTSGNPAPARAIAAALEQVQAHWPQVRIARVAIEPAGDLHAVEVELQCGPLAPHWLRVQVYADPVQGRERQLHDLALEPASAGATAIYRGMVPALHPPGDYTARVVPAEATGLSVPLEARQIAWQR